MTNEETNNKIIELVNGRIADKGIDEAIAWSARVLLETQERLESAIQRGSELVNLPAHLEMAIEINRHCVATRRDQKLNELGL
jgi:hypothetical protein